ncbi:MAG: gamma-glutamyl-gamma-aminobutyrate hydrolase family protein [Trueperaceae bacterium]
MQPRILITTNSETLERNVNRVYTTVALQYADAIAKAGGLPFFVGNLSPELAESYVETCDGVLLSGGVDVDPVHFGQLPEVQLGFVDESRDLFELALYKAAKRKGLPILGICRGIQLINVAEGGTLHQHLPNVADTIQHSQVNQDGTLFHEVRLDSNSVLAKAFSKITIRTDSYHHQGLDKLGRELKPIGWSKDGLVEAIEGTGKTFVLGVQWHPEMSFVKYPDQLAPFTVFMETVRKTLEPSEFILESSE